jgi:hypothetical protein
MHRIVVLALVSGLVIAAAPSDGQAGRLFGRGGKGKATTGTDVVVYRPPGAVATTGPGRALARVPGRALVPAPGRAIVPAAGRAPAPVALRRFDLTAPAPAAASPAAAAAPRRTGRLRKLVLTTGLAAAMVAGFHVSGVGDATLAPAPQIEAAPNDGADNVTPADPGRQPDATVPGVSKSRDLQVFQNGRVIGVRPGAATN